jgi:hypothetical protein
MDIQFEAWARKMSMDLEYRNIPGVGQFYECPRTLLALEAWQASRAAIEVELPKIVDKEWENTHAERSAMREAIGWCKKRIESLGLKVKP